MELKNHQEKQKEHEQILEQTRTNPKLKKNRSEDKKILNQSELIEMSGILFDLEDHDKNVKTTTTTINSNPEQQQINQIPLELQQAQQAAQKAQLQLLNDNQQLQQALYELHQAQEKVKQCQYNVQQSQQYVQTTQAAANSIINKLH